MRVHVSMYLVNAKHAEHDHCQRIGPQFVHPEANYQQGFREPVRDQIDRSEFPPTVRERLGPMKKVGDDDFVVFSRQIVERGDAKEVVHGAGLDKPDQHAADAFEQAVESLDRDSGLESLIEE